MRSTIQPRLMIIEDEPRLASLVAQMASEWGWLTRVAQSAEESRRIHADFDPHAIATDLVLPNQSGLDYLDSMRKSGWTGPVILMTAFGDLDSARRAIRLGVVELLVKPFDLGELESALARCRSSLNFSSEVETQADPTDSHALADVERQCILDSLARHNGNRTAAARELGISRRTIYNKLGRIDPTP